VNKFQGIDVVLRMDWISKYNGLIICAKKIVKLIASIGKDLEYLAKSLVTDKTTSNKIVLNQLDATSTKDRRTVSEFLHVFSKGVTKYVTRS
jgi:hypothetical protein